MLDFHRVPSVDKGRRTIARERLLHDLTATGRNCGLVWDAANVSRYGQVSRNGSRADNPQIKTFSLLDEAIEWAEDQLIYRYGGWHQNGASITRRPVVYWQD